MNELVSVQGFNAWRASDRDRDRTIADLNDGLWSGRLSGDEHAVRVAAALTATTLGDLGRLTGDIPNIHHTVCITMHDGWLAPVRPPPPDAPWGGVVNPMNSWPPATLATRPTNALAVVAFIFSLFGVALATFYVGGIVAAGLGLYARREIRSSPTPESGDGLAVAAITIGILATLLGIALVGTKYW